MRALAVACAVLWLATGANAGELPSNHDLIAAMPPGTLGVLVVRLAGLDPDALAALKPLVHEWSSVPHYARQEGDTIRTIARRAIAEGGLLAFASGGSEFTAAPDIGIGNFNERCIWLTEQPLGTLEAQLERGEQGVKDYLGRFEVHGVTVHHGAAYYDAHGPTKPVREAIYLAVVSQRIVLAAEQRSDIEHMVRSMLKPPAEIAEHWRAVASGIDLSEPVIVLRHYDPEDGVSYLSPVHPRVPPSQRIRFHSVGLSVPDPSDFTIRINAIAADPDRAIDWLRNMGFPERHYDLRVEANDRGFAGKARDKRDTPEEQSVALSGALMILYGLYFAI